MSGRVLDLSPIGLLARPMGLLRNGYPEGEMGGSGDGIFSDLLNKATGAVEALDGALKRQANRNKDYPIPVADKYLAKCATHSEGALREVKRNAAEAAQILRADRVQRVLNTTAMAAVCAATCSCWASLATRSTLTLTTGEGLAEAFFVGAGQNASQRFALGVARNMVVQYVLQGGDAFMNEMMTGSSQKSISANAPAVLFNAIIAGGLPAAKASDCVKLVVHLIRVDILTRNVDDKAKIRAETVEGLIKQVPRQEAEAQFWKVKAGIIRSIKSQGGELSEKIYNEMVSTEVLGKLKEQVIIETEKQVPGVNWLTALKTMHKAVNRRGPYGGKSSYSQGDINADLKDNMTRAAAFTLEHHVFRNVGASIFAAKTIHQAFCEQSDKVTPAMVLG